MKAIYDTSKPKLKEYEDLYGTDDGVELWIDAYGKWLKTLAMKKPKEASTENDGHI